ncbi:MAG TPA: 50S ribosomal protein L2, partial [Candidatus Omnitrophota bacterium]|nr:50S ribosomal protein L2 [Candidatus Omnitrophota bacterium]
MGIKRYKPITNGLRHTALSDFSDITKSTPEKALLRPLKKTGGRNMFGRITVRFRGGGHKRMYRLIDFKRQRVDEPAEVLAIEYDPNRSVRIALVQYPDKSKSYILAPLDLRVGDNVISVKERSADIKAG